jgi:hypothetical protein
MQSEAVEIARQGNIDLPASVPVGNDAALIQQVDILTMRVAELEEPRVSTKSCPGPDGQAAPPIGPVANATQPRARVNGPLAMR